MSGSRGGEAGIPFAGLPPAIKFSKRKFYSRGETGKRNLQIKDRVNSLFVLKGLFRGNEMALFVVWIGQFYQKAAVFIRNRQNWNISQQIKKFYHVFVSLFNFKTKKVNFEGQKGVPKIFAQRFDSHEFNIGLLGGRRFVERDEKCAAYNALPFIILT